MIVRNSLGFMSAGALVILAACGGGEPSQTESKPPAAPPGRAPAAAGGRGTAWPPPPEKVNPTADPKCAAMHKDGLERTQIHVKDGGLADVLVYVKSGASGTYPAPADPAGLDQKGCAYTP